jgi:hypothetical protein
LPTPLRGVIDSFACAGTHFSTYKSLDLLSRAFINRS